MYQVACKTSKPELSKQATVSWIDILLFLTLI